MKNFNDIFDNIKIPKNKQNNCLAYIRKLKDTVQCDTVQIVSKTCIKDRKWTNLEGNIIIHLKHQDTELQKSIYTHTCRN